MFVRFFVSHSICSQVGLPGTKWQKQCLLQKNLANSTNIGRKSAMVKKIKNDFKNIHSRSEKKTIEHERGSCSMDAQDVHFQY